MGNSVHDKSSYAESMTFAFKHKVEVVNGCVGHLFLCILACYMNHVF